MKKYIMVLMIIAIVALVGCTRQKANINNKHVEYSIISVNEGFGKMTIEELENTLRVKGGQVREFSSCKDPDNGPSDIFKKGQAGYYFRTFDENKDQYVSYRNGSLQIDKVQFWDKCESGGVLIERVCLGDEPGYREIRCPTFCIDGRCTAINYGGCSDSEKGKNLDEKGTISYNYTYLDVMKVELEKFMEMTDSCVNDSYVLERYCKGDRPYAEEFRCEGRCVSGVCV